MLEPIKKYSLQNTDNENVLCRNTHCNLRVLRPYTKEGCGGTKQLVILSTLEQLVSLSTSYRSESSRLSWPRSS